MEIRIGIQHVGREIVIESNQSAETVKALVDDALRHGNQLTLTDTKGRTVIAPGQHIGYVEVGAEEVRHVGFGAL